jgi:hypothetical protein
LDGRYRPRGALLPHHFTLTGAEALRRYLFCGTFRGGSLTITGTANDGINDIATGTLVQGSFDNVTVSGGTFALTMISFGTDTKNQDLVDFFGLGEAFTFANTQIALGSVTIDPNGGFSGTVTNADFDNLAVPVPPAVWLFGSGLLGLVGVARRRS